MNQAGTTFEWPTTNIEHTDLAHTLAQKAYPNSDPTPDGSEHSAQVVILEEHYGLYDSSSWRNILGANDNAAKYALMLYADLTFNRTLANLINTTLNDAAARRVVLLSVIGAEALESALANPNTKGGRFGRYLRGAFVTPQELPQTQGIMVPNTLGYETPEQATKRTIYSQREALKRALTTLRTPVGK